MDHEEILRLTEKYGGQWALCHAQRILNTIAEISGDIVFQHEPLWLAAHLHDWGGYAEWLQPGVDHAVRSRDIACEFLKERSCPWDLAERTLECIEFHHGGPAERSIESILFTDADALDLLGTVGVLRIFSMNSRNLQAAVKTLRQYRDMSGRAITLPAARKIADERIREMDVLMSKFQQETGGIF